MTAERWWYEGWGEPHIVHGREDMPAQLRKWDDYLADRFTCAEIAYLIERGLVCDGYPLFLTRKGQEWLRRGAGMPPANNKVFNPDRRLECSADESL